MKTINYLKVCFFCLSLLLLSNRAFASQTPHAQLSSSMTQLASLNQLPRLVILENVDSFFSLVPFDNGVIVNDPGTYFISVHGQAGIGRNSSQPGTVYLTLLQNDAAITHASSASRQINRNDSIDDVCSQFVLHLQAGDTITVQFSATNSAFGLLAANASFQTPDVPSVVFTMFRIGN